MVVLTVLAFFAVFLFLLFCCPVKVEISLGTGEKFKYKIIYFFIVYNSEKKKEKNKKKKSEKEKEKSENKKEKNSTDFKEVLNIIKSLSEDLFKFASKIYISDFDLFISVASDDAAETAVNYGRYNAAVHTVLSAVKNIFEIKKQKIFIVPDFKGDKTVYSLKSKILVKGIYVLIFAVSALKKIIKTL